MSDNVWKDRYERAAAAVEHLRDLCRSHRDDAYRANRRLTDVRDYAQAVLDGAYKPTAEDFARDMMDIYQRPLPPDKWQEKLVPYLEN